MKNRILAQILILCIVFSTLHMTAWATPEVIPYPYIEDVRNNGQIPADKFLTIIATSNDLYITSIALKAINADSGKENIPATSGSLQVSRFSNGCYEYKQDFVLDGNLKITGGKWSFEVTSTYKPIKGGTEAKSSIRKLPSDYEKAHWYPYYTIVNGTSEVTPPPPSDNPLVSTPDDSPVSTPDNPPVSTPNNLPVSTLDDPPVSTLDDPPVSLPVITEHYSTDSTVIVNSTAYVNAGISTARSNVGDIQKAVNQAIQNSSANVNVKVNIPNNVSVDSVQVDFPTSVIKDLANRTNASLTVTTPLAIVTIPNDSLSQIDHSANNFTIFATFNTSNTLRIALSQDAQTIGALSSGMKVELPFSYMPRTSGIVAILINPDGTEYVLPTKTGRARREQTRGGPLVKFSFQSVPRI